MEAVERVEKHIGIGIWCVLECLSKVFWIIFLEVSF